MNRWNPRLPRISRISRIRFGLLAILAFLCSSGALLAAAAEPPASSVDALAEELARRLSAHFPLHESRVLRVSGGDVYLKGDALPEGMKMEVFRDEGPITDPDTFEDVGRVMRPVGTIEILESSGDITIGEIIESKGKIEAGDTARSGGRPLRFDLLNARPEDPDSAAAFRVISGILPYRLESTGRFLYQAAGEPPFPPGLLLSRDLEGVRSFLLETRLDFILNLCAVRSVGRLTVLCEVVSSTRGLPSDVFTVETPVDTFLWNYLASGSTGFTGSPGPTAEPEIGHEEPLRAEWIGNVRERILDSAAWDIDGDGRDEIFLLEPGSISCVAIGRGGLKEIRRIEMGRWEPNPVKSRSPAGVIRLARIPGANETGIFIASNALRTGWLYRWREKKAEPLPAQPVAQREKGGKISVLLDRFLPGEDVFSGEVSVLELGEIESKPARRLAPYLKIQPSTGSDLLLLREGGEMETLADTLESKGRLETLSGTALLRSRDLFVTTSGNPPGEPDTLTLFSSQRNPGSLAVDFRNSILSVSEGDLDGDGAEELFVAEDAGAEGTSLKVFSLPPPAR